MEQPYSMCPVLRWRCVQVLPAGRVHLTAPATGGSRLADSAEVLIRLTLAPPRAVLREAAKAGVNTAGLRRLVPGLVEALQRGKVGVR